MENFGTLQRFAQALPWLSYWVQVSDKDSPTWRL